MKSVIESSVARVCAVAMAMTLLFAGTAIAKGTPFAHVEKRGEGDQAMILIHGLSTDWRIWEDFMERNSAQYTMYAISLPGSSGSEAPPMPEVDEEGARDPDESTTPWMDNAVRQLRNLVRDEDIDSPVVIGHTTLGGVLATRLALEYPKYVSQVIAVDAFLPWMPMGDGARVSIEERNASADETVFLIKQFDNDRWEQSLQVPSTYSINEDRVEWLAGVMRETEASVKAQWLNELIRFDLETDLHDLAAPMLATYMTVDSPPTDVRAWQAQQKREQSMRLMGSYASVMTAKFVNCKNYIMWDFPEQFDETVANFISGQPIYDFVAPPEVKAPEAAAPE